MAKIIYLINAFFGILFGVGVLLFSLFYLMEKDPSKAIPFIIAGVVGLAFGVYQVTKYRGS